MYGNDLENENESPLEYDPKINHLGYEKDPTIKKMNSNEKLLFSDLIYKKNKFGFNQSRNFVFIY